MSDHQELDHRVGALEREQARQGERLARIETDVGKVASGMEKLLERDARRPQALSWPQIAGAVITTLCIMGGLWTLTTGIVEHSPAVMALQERMNRAEWRYGWTGRVERE